jgi:hypothetical protein
MEKYNTAGRILFTTALLLGGISVGWMCSVFMLTNALALTITLVIGGIYSVGVIELIQFRNATTTLLQALLKTKEKVAVIDDWLDTLDVSLQNSVRLRIQGERVGLPAPILTPYFVGLLVMLGLLGTFVGMVDTLKGAVIALEGTTELSAIRAGLAAPIKGLGLAFGTSIAGVATSAMLGLMSTLSRRDRMLATRRLDTKAAVIFQDFSLVHSQQETFKALQLQTRALPEVSNKLHAMANKLEQVGNQLITSQDRFHASVGLVFSELAVSMDKTHKESLEQNIRLAGESIKPIVAEAMHTIAQESQNVHKNLIQTSGEHLNALSGKFVDTSAQVTQSLKTALADQHQSNNILIDHMRTSLHDFKGQFEHMAETMGETFKTLSASLIEHQKTSDKNRLDSWTAVLENTQKESAQHLAESSKVFSSELKQVVDMHQKTFEATTNDLVSVSATLTSKWQQAGKDTMLHQKDIANSLKDTMTAITDDMHTTSTQLYSEISELLKSSEDLIQTRINTEATWLEGHQERMDTLTQMLQSELLLLRKDEEQRGQAAVERLTNLESVLAAHLTTIGQALEAPMIRLIQTAEQAPQAAADVISRLRQEASERAEQDTRQLEEQGRIIKEIDTLSRSLAQTSTDQHAAIEQLVNQSKGMLENVACQFNERMGAEATKFSEVAENFAGSAVEMASLGDSFSMAVTLFNESNEHMIQNLIRIEESLEKATSRSDEQLGYYVAQAREIIDHCMLSQKEIFEDLQKLQQNSEISLAG